MDLSVLDLGFLDLGFLDLDFLDLDFFGSGLFGSVFFVLDLMFGLTVRVFRKLVSRTFPNITLVSKREVRVRG